jgi:phage-related minor tail protein
MQALAAMAAFDTRQPLQGRNHMDSSPFKTPRFDATPLASMQNLMKELRKSSDEFGKSITGAFAKGVVEGKRFEDILQNVGKALAENLLKAALKPLELSLSGGLNTLLGSAFTGTNIFPSATGDIPTFAQGGVFAAGRVRAFAEGGVVASPTYFPMSGGAGLMGERGPEAIMPLARGADGKLGVKSGGGSRPVNVTVNVTTPDADSFRKSESQVSAAIARAAARGRRAL